MKKFATFFALSAFLITTIPLLNGADEATDTPQPESAQTDAPQEKPDGKESTETGEESMLLGEDGWFDISKFVDQAYGFIPLVIPITEPAVGYGAVGLVAFMDKPDKVEEGEAMRPNITAVGGMATENGTWGVFGADIRNWFDGSVESLLAAGYVDVNLSYYPTPPPEGQEDEPLAYNMKVAFGSMRGRYRFKGTPWSVALGYTYAQNQLTISGELLPPREAAPEFTQNLAALTPLVTYDSRDNIFTPTRGLFVQLDSQFFGQAWGGDEDYQIPGLMAFGYFPAADTVTLGLKIGGRSAHGDVPFYQLPFIQLRGVPALRYQGDFAGEIEAEVRWQFYKRFSLVGFGGHGIARLDGESETTTESATTWGLGFRYEIARGYGMHMGIDIARGPEDTIFYIQFGSAWFAP